MKSQPSRLLLMLLSAALSLALSGCSALQGGGTHEMGPPGRSRTMSDGFMLQQGEAGDGGLYR